MTKTIRKTGKKVNQNINFTEVYRQMNFIQVLSLSVLAISFLSFLIIIFAFIDNNKINLS